MSDPVAKLNEGLPPGWKQIIRFMKAEGYGADIQEFPKAGKIVRLTSRYSDESKNEVLYFILDTTRPITQQLRLTTEEETIAWAKETYGEEIPMTGRPGHQWDGPPAAEIIIGGKNNLHVRDVTILGLVAYPNTPGLNSEICTYRDMIRKLVAHLPNGVYQALLQAEPADPNIPPPTGV